MVQPSWVHTPSTVVNPLALVRATRNSPATDSTSAAPPTLANAVPVALTCALDAATRPMSVGSVDAGVLGDVGPSPPQAETNVASAAHDAAWHAPAQNCLREMNSFASDIARNPCDL